MKHNLKSYESSNWIRVSKSNPCTQCSKPDWCTYTEEGSVCCMRTQSSKPMKNGGWLHVNGDTTKIIKIYRKPEVRDDIDFPSLWKEISKGNTPNALMVFAEKLGVDPMSLYSIGCQWSIRDCAWAFPMKDENSNIIGIRLRAENGTKWSVKGSSSGLFIPTMTGPINNVLMICEGPSDAAAALCLGYQSIGRPSCQGQEQMIRKYVKINKFKRAIIMSDNDEPGLLGASKLQSEIAVTSCVVTLPCKDLRAFYGYGGTKEMIESILRDKVWTKV